MACPVHGANRLGGILLDLVVFGRASGLYIEKALREGIELRDASQTDIEEAGSMLNALNQRETGEQVGRCDMSYRRLCRTIWRFPNG